MCTRSAIVRSGLLLALLLAPVASHADSVEDARALLARYVESTGGRAAFLADTALRAKGRVTDAGLEGRFEYTRAWPARLLQSEQVGTLRTRAGEIGRASCRERV